MNGINAGKHCRLVHSYYIGGSNKYFHDYNRVLPSFSVTHNVYVNPHEVIPLVRSWDESQVRSTPGFNPHNPIKYAQMICTIFNFNIKWLYNSFKMQSLGHVWGILCTFAPIKKTPCLSLRALSVLIILFVQP